jgi:hypothetical protein
MSDHRPGAVVRFGCNIDPYLLANANGNLLLAEQCSCELDESAFNDIVEAVERAASGDTRAAAGDTRGSSPGVYFVHWGDGRISCHRFGSIH